MLKQLKIFADKKWLPNNCNHVIMLYPFWGDIPLSIEDPDSGRFDEYLNKGNEIFKMVTSIEECDYAVLPFEYSFDVEKKQLSERISKEALNFGKKLIVFFNSDINNDILLDNAIIFRTSFFKSCQPVNVFAFPGWSIDFLKKYSVNEFILSKKEMAEISYCGYVDTLQEKSILNKIKSLASPIKKESFDYGSYIRGKAIRTLLKANKIKTKFIIRDGFWAQGINDKHKVRKEYFFNMFNSPYAFVTRGAGNFSYRLYEVMCCGRIPVFIDTDSVLPYEQLINWKKQSVWIDEKNVSLIEEKLKTFHNSISKEDFEDLQKQNREIYETYLSPVGFFKHLNTLI